MLKQQQILSALSLALLVGFSFRPTQTIAQTTPDCTNPSSTPDERYCARQAYEDADRRLNEVWQQVLPTLSSEAQEQLIDRQLNWLDFRDATCTHETRPFRNGTGYPVFFNQCLENLTEQRTSELEGYLRQNSARTSTPIAPARADENGNYSNRSDQTRWQVVDPDPNGLNCRMGGTLEDIHHGHYNNTFPNILDFPVVATLEPGSLFESRQNPGGFAVYGDDRGLPWVYVPNLGCFVRANSSFIAPISH